MTDDEAQEHNSTEEVERSILELLLLKEQKKEIEAEIADIEKYLDKALEKEHRFKDGPDQVSATVVRGFVDRFDDHLISSRYTVIWDVITKRVIDKGKYLEAVRVGTITPELHAKFHHSAPKKSYVVVSRVKQEEE